MAIVAAYWGLWLAGLIVFECLLLIMYYKFHKKGTLVTAVLESANETLSNVDGKPIGKAVGHMVTTTAKTMAKAMWPMIAVVLLVLVSCLLLGLSTLIHLVNFFKG